MWFEIGKFGAFFKGGLHCAFFAPFRGRIAFRIPISRFITATLNSYQQGTTLRKVIFYAILLVSHRLMRLVSEIGQRADIHPNVVAR
ncbi:MAG: hypothetical protein NT023_22400 [Armatimonadetes bacterium]|nr:hypothetical protein [Armatimonadota bacterium]